MLRTIMMGATARAHVRMARPPLKHGRVGQTAGSGRLLLLLAGLAAVQQVGCNLPPLERAATVPVAMHPLYDAARKGELDKLQALLKTDKAADVNAPIEEKAWRPLHAAARGGFAAVVEVLLGAGAVPDAVTEGNWTALHWAVRHSLKLAPSLQLRSARRTAVAAMRAAPRRPDRKRRDSGQDWWGGRRWAVARMQMQVQVQRLGQQRRVELPVEWQERGGRRRRRCVAVAVAVAGSECEGET